MKRLILSGLSVLFLGAASATAVSAQTTAQNPVMPSGINSTGNMLNYQYGTRIYQNGAINTPSGSVIYPATSVNHGNGSTTYYYQDGTSITNNNNTVSPSGTFLTPGSLNGGLRN